jgi:CRISPR-associated endonuclease/helicase Cas3
MFRYWGKARPTTTATLPWHPLVYHSLDVAASGNVFLQQHQHLRLHLAHQLGFQDDQIFLHWLTFFLALHDLGKFAEGFQGQHQALFVELHGQRDVIRPYAVRHDSLGFLFWREALRQRIEQEDWLGLHLSERGWRSWRRALYYWVRAVTGHHGKPPSEQDGILSHYFSETDQQAAVAFCREARDVLLPNIHQEQLPSVDVFATQSKRLSWWLAGITVLADWVGSNQDFFPYQQPDMPLAEYWKATQKKATAALQNAGVLPAMPAAPQQFQQLFPGLSQATPLQQCVADLPLGDGPQLFILEDVTGAGKTEAALMLAHRLMSAGIGNGVYLGLPTMATADAMFTRMEAIYQHLFAEAWQPSLILAHSARDLSARFRQAVLPSVHTMELDYVPPDEQTASARCKAWLADNRKRALLAQVGVGTIDQALLAILYARHQSLRLLGLFGKVLIVDEVHACDAYMHRLLRVLLRFHASIGGSVILLSATLPQTMRAELVQAFCEGAGIDIQALVAKAYPLLTHVSAAGTVEVPLATRSGLERFVSVEWLTDLDDVTAHILQASQSGRCVCWVRNTVADARAAFEALQGHIPDDKLHLFHARFAMQDRLAIEHQVLTYFDKQSNGAMRMGRVVVATQVVEQSLDLDFDVMISDLAPIDLLIQRAGRLCRHARDQEGNPIAGPDQRGAPQLLVYGPEPEKDAARRWFAAVFPKAVKVYPDHGQLWLTATLLREHGGFQMPEDARGLIEGVYGEDAEQRMPAALQEVHYAVQGEYAANRSQAQLNSIDLDAGYEANTLTWWDDAVTPTRLGEPTTAVRLARWDGQTLRPWADGEFAWHLSQVQVRQTLIKGIPEFADDKALQAAVQQVMEDLPDRGKWSILLPLQNGENGVWRGKVMNGRGDSVTVLYHTQRGLMLEDEA